MAFDKPVVEHWLEQEIPTHITTELFIFEMSVLFVHNNVYSVS